MSEDKKRKNKYEKDKNTKREMVHVCKREAREVKIMKKKKKREKNSKKNKNSREKKEKIVYKSEKYK